MNSNGHCAFSSTGVVESHPPLHSVLKEQVIEEEPDESESWELKRLGRSICALERLRFLAVVRSGCDENGHSRSAPDLSGTAVNILGF